MSSAKVLYTANTRTTGGRENGISRSFDGCLDVRLSTPGSTRISTKPGQLFVAGWSASQGLTIHYHETTQSAAGGPVISMLSRQMEMP